MITRVALITGCGKRDGVGRGIALALAGSGVSVVVTDIEHAGVLNRRQELTGAPEQEWQGISSLAEEITVDGGEACYLLGDISDEEDARRLVGETTARYGRLDILVNNAAAPQGLDRADIEKVPIDVWDRVIEINLRGTYLMSRFAVPVMRGQRYGRIINIASTVGLVSAANSTAYSTSKAAVLGLTRALSADVATWGITVNAIAPGMVATSRAIGNEDPDFDVAAELERRSQTIPVGRPGRPDDIAAAVAYLASEASSYMTGQTLILDGGGISPFPLPRPTNETAAKKLTTIRRTSPPLRVNHAGSLLQEFERQHLADQFVLCRR